METKKDNKKKIFIFVIIALVAIVVIFLVKKAKEEANKINSYISELREVANKYFNSDLSEKNIQVEVKDAAIFTMLKSEIAAGKWTGKTLDEVVQSHVDFLKNQKNFLVKIFIK